MQQEQKKYSIVLLITILIFVSVFALVNFLNNRKISHITLLQENISLDLLAIETQFDLLKTLPCDRVETSLLSRELSEFGKKLAFAEESQGANNPNVLQLKKNYSLLQVKDYLLMQELSKKCRITTDFVLYFYKQECPECREQGNVLTKLKQKYPKLRIYSFDSNLDFAVMDTFMGLYTINDYPSMIINNKVHQGLRTEAELEALLPELVAEKEHEDLILSGKQFIVDQEIYTQDIRYIELVKEIGNRFIYEISGEEEGTQITVELIADSSGEFRFRRN